jgi:hypothetical protein
LVNITMRVTEIIRGILDVIDGVDSQTQTTEIKPEATAYSDSDIKRFKQIVDLAGDDTAADIPIHQKNSTQTLML